MKTFKYIIHSRPWHFQHFECVCDFSTGVISEGSESLKAEKVQAKFLRGELSYSDQELNVLKEWLEKQDYELLRKLFEQKIVIKSPNAIAYSASSIARVFKELEKTKHQNSQ